MGLRRTGPISGIRTERAPTEMIAEILELCMQSTVRTKVMHKTRIFYPATLKFLKNLQKTELLELDSENKSTR